MTYIPKSQIIVKMADPGKFQYESSGEPYTGYYIETSKGTKHAGANNILLGPIIIPVKISSNKRHGSSRDVKKFDLLKDNLKEFLSNTQPIPVMKKFPSESDYEKGFFKRYFSRKIDSSGYQEIDKEVYDSIIKQDKKYDHNLYEVGNIKWNLKGNIFKSNALTLKLAERRYKNISYLFPIFNEFAKEPFKNQENLLAAGELYFGDGEPYFGYYHVHTTKGPMVGSYHTKMDHQKLYYTDELPIPADKSYEDFLEGLSKNPTSHIPIRPNLNLSRNVVINSPITSSIIESYNCIVAWGTPPPGYQGIANEDGLVPAGSACIDPGDGNGLYLAVSGGDISMTALQRCQFTCEGGSGISTGGGIGCMMAWDTNYCSSCTTHDQSLCANNYSTGTGTGLSGGSSYGSGGSGYGGGFGTGNCFIGETSIIMEDGTIKRIDEIIVGDIVKSEINTSIVGDIDIHKGTYTIYSINDSEAFVTSEHPFKTTTGWKAINPLETFKKHGIESNVLEIGDILITKEGTEELKSINKSIKTTDTVYNLQLDNEHVYYANGYLVHNNKTGGSWSLEDLEIIQNDYGGSAVEQCPCGMWQGVMQYSESCC
tara:strand:- start:62 stop:1852 length:1791 start_codon:yes stop_codon:yes gene_type:complete